MSNGCKNPMCLGERAKLREQGKVLAMLVADEERYKIEIGYLVSCLRVVDLQRYDTYRLDERLR